MELRGRAGQDVDGGVAEGVERVDGGAGGAAAADYEGAVRGGWGGVGGG